MGMTASKLTLLGLGNAEPAAALIASAPSLSFGKGSVHQMAKPPGRVNLTLFRV